MNPIVNTACEPSTRRPSSHATTTLSPSRVDADRPRALQQLHAPAEELVLERRRDLRDPCTGSTCWRDTTSVTCAPSALNMCVNSTPVTPEPITTRCSGISGGGYAWRLSRMRSPSSVAQSGIRGREPVESRIASASISSTPSSVTAATVRGTDQAAGAADQAHALRLEQARRCRRAACPRCRRCARAARRRRARRARRVPSCAAWPSSVSSLPVATIALLGMQSHRCAAPPTTSRSMSVTSAPSDAATVAAVLPAGPPPMITKRTAT